MTDIDAGIPLFPLRQQDETSQPVKEVIENPNTGGKCAGLACFVLFWMEGSVHGYLIALSNGMVLAGRCFSDCNNGSARTVKE